MAAQNPDINYIGIDIQMTVLSYALDRVLEAGLPNIKLLQVDGSSLTNYFAPAEIDQLYLNFSDPWPKKRHEKRRLTYKSFLDTYKEILPEKEKSTSKQIIVVCLSIAWLVFLNMAWS